MNSEATTKREENEVWAKRGIMVHEEKENRMLDKLLQAAAEVCEWIRQTGDWFGHLLLLILPPPPPD